MDLCEGTAAYQYQRLTSKTSIRVLELYQGRRSDDIKCTLHQVDLENAPPYEAISYAWGNPADEGSVLCDSKIIMVTQNLKNALVQFRHEGNSRFMWADAICVNQNDNAERGSQVKIMKSIYDRASRVCIWLGNTTAQMLPAFDFINKRVEILDNEDYSKSDLPEPSGDQWLAVAEFYSATWFQRLWVVQEVYNHVCTVFCGEYEVPWSGVVLVAQFILEQRTTNNIPIILMGVMYSVISALQINTAGHENRTTNIFDVFRHFRCSDQRDKVYALLSFPPLKGLQPPIQPDYSKSVVEVFEETTVRVFESCHSLDLLSSIEHHGVVDENWPSWVPRWDQRRNIQILHSYASGRAYSSLPRITFKPKIMVSEGIGITKLSWCGMVIGDDKSAHNDSDIDPLEQALQEWLSQCDPRIESLNEDLLNYIAMTLTVGLDYRSNCPPLDESQFRLDYISYLTDVLPSLDMHDIIQPSYSVTDGQNRSANSINYYTAAFRGSRNKRLFCTPDGSLGMAPQAAQTGDFVVLLYGSNAPCVLRNKGSHYQYVGECYLHQHMHGEAIKMVAEGLLAEEEFEIR